MYDVIIIGKGPAGISAALYTARANLNTFIISKNESSLLKTEKIENYYGFAEAIKGSDLLEAGIKQALKVGANIVDEEVLSIEKQNNFIIKTTKGKYEAKAILLTTGQSQKKLEINNLKELEGKGISYCTTCDGFFYKKLKVGVLGSKDFAIHELKELEAFTSNITLFTNAEEIKISDESKNILDKYTIENRKIKSFEGVEFLEKVIFEDDSSEKLDGIFIAQETASSLDFARKLGVIIEDNSIVVNKYQETNLEGLFAAGDCTGGFKQIATAVGQGALAGRKIIEYLRKISK